MTVGKRIGWTGLSILALVAAFGVQIVASMIIILPYALVEGIRQGMQAANGQDPGRMAEEFMANMGMWHISWGLSWWRRVCCC